MTLFILEGQRTLIYLSDPLSNGANVFGTGLLAVNTGITNHSGTIAVIQVLAVVCGHLMGVISAHDRAVALFPRGGQDDDRQLPCRLVGAQSLQHFQTVNLWQFQVE